MRNLSMGSTDFSPVDDRLHPSIWPLWPVVFGALFVVSEQGFRREWQLVGVVAYFLIFLGVLLVAALEKSPSIRAYCLAVSLFPISRVIGNGLALEQYGPFAEEVTISIALLIAAIQVIRLQGLTRDDVLIRAGGRMRVDGPVIAIVAVVLGVVGAWLSGARLTFDVLGAPPALIAGGVVLAWAGAFIECLVFMGLLLPATQRLLGPWLGAGYVAAIWAIRFGFMPWTYMGAMLVEGLILAVVTTRTRSMLYAVLAHWLIIVAFFATAGVLG